MLTKCDELVATIFDIHDVVVWSDNFIFPSAVFTRDYYDLESLGFGLIELIQARQQSCSHSRLSAESIRLSGGDQSSDGVLPDEMAEEDVAVLTGPPFVPNRVPSSLSPAYSIS